MQVEWPLDVLHVFNIARRMCLLLDKGHGVGLGLDISGGQVEVVSSMGHWLCANIDGVMAVDQKIQNVRL